MIDLFPHRNFRNCEITSLQIPHHDVHFGLAEVRLACFAFCENSSLSINMRKNTYPEIFAPFSYLRM